MPPYTMASRVLVLKVKYLIVNLSFGGFENFFKYFKHMVHIFDLLITCMHEPIFNFVVVCINLDYQRYNIRGILFIVTNTIYLGFMAYEWPL